MPAASGQPTCFFVGRPGKAKGVGKRQVRMSLSMAVKQDQEERADSTRDLMRSYSLGSLTAPGAHVTLCAAPGRTGARPVGVGRLQVGPSPGPSPLAARQPRAAVRPTPAPYCLTGEAQTSKLELNGSSNHPQHHASESSADLVGSPRVDMMSKLRRLSLLTG